MNNKIVLLTALSSILFISSTSALANDNIECSIKVVDGLVNCSVEVEEVKGNGISLVVTPKDKSLSYENICAVAVLKSKENTYSFAMPENAVQSGNVYYTAYLRNGIDTEEKFDFVYVEPEILNETIIPELKSTDADTFESVAAKSTQSGLAYKTALESIGFDFEAFDNLSSNAKKNALTLLFDAGFTQTENSKLADLFNYSVYIAEFSEGSVNADTILTKLNTEFDNKTYKEYDAEAKAFISSCVKKSAPYTSCDNYEKSYGKACVFNKLNKARYNEIDSILSTNSVLLGLNTNSDYNTYLSLSADKKIGVADKMVNLIAAAPISNLSVLQSYLKSSLPSIITPTPSGDGGEYSAQSIENRINSTEDGFFSIGDNAAFEREMRFTDIDNYGWAKEAISTLYYKEVISGIDEEHFSPASSVTKEQMVKMIVSAAGLNGASVEIEFEDVDENQWYYTSILSGVANKIAFGMDEKSFGVGTQVTRQDTAVMIFRAMKAIGKECNYIKDAEIFSDNDEIAEYAKEATDCLYKMGIISGLGDGRFAPRSTCTRAEAAKMIYDAFAK